MRPSGEKLTHTPGPLWPTSARHSRFHVPVRYREGRPSSAFAARYRRVWQRGVLQPSFDAGFLQSTALDVNDRGVVLGQGLQRADRTRMGWLWNGKKLTLLPLPGGTTLTMLRRLNQRGDVVGTLQNQQGIEFAVRWTAPRYRPRILPPTPGDAGSFGHGINNRGTAAGASDRDDGRQSSVLWDRRGRTQILPRLAVAPGRMALPGLASSKLTRRRCAFEVGACLSRDAFQPVMVCTSSRCTWLGSWSRHSGHDRQARGWRTVSFTDPRGCSPRCPPRSAVYPIVSAAGAGTI